MSRRRLLDRPDLGNKIAALGDQVAAGLDLQANRMAKCLNQPLARGIPQPVVCPKVDELLAGPIRDRQAAAGTDRGDRRPDLPAQLLHGAAHLRQVLEVSAEPICMCTPVIERPCCAASAEHLGKLRVPDAVLRVVAAGVRLVAVAVAEARVDSQGDRAARRELPELPDHVGRAEVDVHPVFEQPVQGPLRRRYPRCRRRAADPRRACSRPRRTARARRR